MFLSTLTTIFARTVDDTNFSSMSSVQFYDQKPLPSKHPNLICTNFNFSNWYVNEHEYFEITLTIENQGNTYASESSTRLYLSLYNDKNTSNDYLVETKRTPGISGKGKISLEYWFYFPSLSSSTSYTVWATAVVDVYDEVDEYWENNTTTSSMSVSVSKKNKDSKPDLVATRYKCPSTAVIDENYSMELYFKNIGEGYASSSTFGVYISYDTILSEYDTFVNQYSLNGLSSNQEIRVDIEFKFPSFFFLGDQEHVHILIQVDRWNEVDESNENNVFYTKEAVSVTRKANKASPKLIVKFGQNSFRLDVDKQTSTWLEIGNEGSAGSMLEFSVSTDSSWISIADCLINHTYYLNHNETFSTKLVIDASFLNPGNYSGSFTIKSNDDNKRITTYEITLFVNDNDSRGYPPKIEYKIDKTKFNLLSRETETTTMIITNEGEKGSVLEGRVYSFEDWIDIESGLFDLERYDEHEVLIRISTMNLEPGRYDGELFISSNDPDEKEVSIRLYLTIEDKTPLMKYSIEETSFSISDDKKDVTYLTIKNNGIVGSVLSGSLKVSEEWIYVDSETFSIKAGNEKRIKVEIHSSLEDGHYKGIITIHSNDPLQSVVNVCIELFVDKNSHRKMSVFLEDNFFELYPGESKSTVLRITHDGVGDSNFFCEVYATEDWISVPFSPQGGFSIEKGSSKELSITISGNGLKPGEYSGNVYVKTNSDIDSWSTEISLIVMQDKVLSVVLQIGNKIAFIQDGVGGSKQQIRLDVPPTIVNGRTMVPLRFLAETFGAQIEWFAEEEEIQITYHDVFVQLWLHRKNGRMFDAMVQKGNDLPTTIVLDTPPAIIQGRTMVPLRFIAETFGAKVEWNDATQTIVLMVTLKE